MFLKTDEVVRERLDLRIREWGGEIVVKAGKEEEIMKVV